MSSKKIFTSCIAFLMQMSQGFANDPSTPTVVRLTPPQISQSTLSEKIVCTRPMRNGKFNISLEQQGNKHIINCYGHGGCGWTTLFGSVEKAIDHFLKLNPSKDTPIRILGSGCMGLTSAIELTRMGYHVEGIYTKEFFLIPSWQAAGYFAFVSVKTSPEEQENLNQIGLNTFRVYQSIDKGEHPYISKEAVRYMPVYCSSETESGVEDLEAKGMIPAREYVTLDFGNGVQHPGYAKFMTYFLNTTTMMRQLKTEVDRLGIKIEKHEVKAFEDVNESILFNCTGLGSRELNNDDLMVPVRGHLVALNDSSGTEHMDYMIYTKVKQEGETEYVYMFPKTVCVLPENTSGVSCVGVLGGTFLPNIDSLSKEEQAAVDKKEFKKLLDRNSEFFLGHPYQD